nr:hypothetical protein [Euzebyales bacterium]
RQLRSQTLRRGGADLGAVGVRVHRRGRTMQVVIRPDAPAEFWLHTLSDPTRVVLDVRR